MRLTSLMVFIALAGSAGLLKGWAADAPEKLAEAAAKPASDSQAGPRPAAVLFVGGLKIDKCWADEKPKGAWIIYEGKRYWYLRENIEKITYLEGEPDSDLKDWLKKSDEARKKEEDRTHQADEEREKRAQAEANNVPAPATGGAAASGGSTTSGSDAFKPGSTQAADTRSPGKNTGSGNDGGTRRTGGGGVVAGTSGNPSGSGIVGGSGVIGGGNLLTTQLGYQWRVKDVDRKLNTIRIKNRLFNEAITLKVKESDDLKHVKDGQILTGMLSAQQPVLNAPDGTVIEFDLSQTPLHPQP
ncbi:MAG: hypothetical protein HY291_18615 [Planctomycetes bacterium]|nr:hypothetical protein [Planctomycetota bacterium]